MTEVIRDVVIRTRIEVEKGNPQFKPLKDGADKVRKSVERVQKETGRLNRVIHESGLVQRRASAESVRGHQNAVRSIQQEITAQNRLTESVKKTGAARKASAAVGGAARPGLGASVMGGLGGANALLGSVGAAIAVLNVDTLAIGGIEGLERFVNLLSAGAENRDVERLGGAINRAAANTLNFFGVDNSLSRNRKFNEQTRFNPQVRQIQNPAEFRLEKEIAKQKELLDVVTRRNDLELGLNRRQIAWIRQREDSLRKQVELERQKIQSSKMQFGLLNFQEKNAAFDIAKKVQKGGLDGLSKEELQFAQGLDVFKDLIAFESKRHADATGFNELLKLTGANTGLKQAELRQKNLQHEINHAGKLEIKVSNREDFARNIAKEVEALMSEQLERQEERMIELAKQESRKAIRRSKMANPSF